MTFRTPRVMKGSYPVAASTLELEVVVVMINRKWSTEPCFSVRASKLAGEKIVEAGKKRCQTERRETPATSMTLRP